MCPQVLRLCSCIVLYYYQCRFRYSCNMISIEERVQISELLNGMDLDDLLSLASTVTKGLLKPNTREEAIEAILLHSESVESILNRKKISRELMFNYLHWKKVTTDSNLDKKSLMSMLLKYWREQQLHNNITNIQQQEQGSRELVSPSVEPGQVDVFANKFTEWFYQLVNKDFLEGGSFAMGSEHFWDDAVLHVLLKSSEQVSTEEAQGNTAVVELIFEVKQRHKLYFSPNLSADGVRGRSEPHGMVSVLVCGTLHQSAGVVVGLFEQIFNLIRDPLTNNSWKIKRSQLSLTSKSNIAALPTLIEGELTRSLLPIENPD